eukprot:comp19893_c0_seq1/m.24107 comp19893_c0_seq1/g.24107  ORF comp19893_c0_seq1/g.24107 comp19893_c0_seq1/m.24107 type:complete len:552 (-) comp19893_c0_seq1:25-1680(-)
MRWFNRRQFIMHGATAPLSPIFGHRRLPRVHWVLTLATWLALYLAVVSAEPGVSPLVKSRNPVNATAPQRPYTVMCDNATSLAELIDQIRQIPQSKTPLGPKVGRVLNGINSVEVFLTDAQVEAIRANEKVQKVFEVGLVAVPKPKKVDPDLVPPYVYEEAYYGYYPWGLDRINQYSLPLDNDTCLQRISGAGVDQYIVDTGIFLEHVQFGGRAFPFFVAKNQFNWISGDDVGHGTLVAGLAGGQMVGVAHNSHLYEVKVLGLSNPFDPTSLYGDDNDVLSGLNAVLTLRNKNRRATVVLSLEGKGTDERYETYFAKLAAEGVPTFVAAGNQNESACDYRPAFAPSAITVGASDWMDEACEYSNWGPCVDVWAPGRAVMSGTIKFFDPQINYYTYADGTSLAAPLAAGVGAIYLSMFPLATTNEVKRAIVLGATYGKLKFTYLPAGQPTTNRTGILNSLFKTECQSANSAVTTEWCKCNGCPTAEGKCKLISAYAPYEKLVSTGKCVGFTDATCQELVLRRKRRKTCGYRDFIDDGCCEVKLMDDPPEGML